MQPQQQEPVFLNTAGAFVSRSRVVLNGVTYPVNAISHVRLFVMRKSPWVLIAGIFAALIAFAQFAAGRPDNGAGLMVIAAVLVKRSRSFLYTSGCIDTLVEPVRRLARDARSPLRPSVLDR